MTTYTWPSTLIPMRMTASYRTISKRFSSPLTGHIQTATRPGSCLVFALSWDVLSEAQHDELFGFIAKLDGQTNWFTIPYYGHVNRGAMGGVPQVNGGGQVGSSISTKSWPANTLILKRGDTVTIGNELKIITDDVTSDGSGNAFLPVRPSQRVAAANNSSLTYNDAYGIFMLENPETAVESVSLPDVRLGSASFSIIEVVSQP